MNSAPPANLLEWLVSSLQLDATVFHMGQYCGSWRASTSGLGRATFHLVLRGSCYLHRPSELPVALSAGDAVFLLRDLPHALSPRAQPESFAEGATRFGEMIDLEPGLPAAIGLVCGFFDFKPGLSDMIAAALPELLVVRANDVQTRAIRSLIELIVLEASEHGAASSALIERLAGLLFLYVIRHVSGGAALPPGMLHAARQQELAPLFQALVSAPGKGWTLASMARVVGMSRATFFKRFREAARCSPLTFLLALRVQVAGRHLLQGENIDAVAQLVGYRSTAAFARAFKRVTGQQPGAYRRIHTGT